MVNSKVSLTFCIYLMYQQEERHLFQGCRLLNHFPLVVAILLPVFVITAVYDSQGF